MSSQDYLKEAAAMIRRAALARKQEADELRHQLDLKDRERKDLLNQKERERALRLDEAAISDSDEFKGAKTRQALLIGTEKSQIEQEFNHEKRLIDEQLHDMQRSIDDLNQLAQRLGG